MSDIEEPLNPTDSAWEGVVGDPGYEAQEDDGIIRMPSQGWKPLWFQLNLWKYMETTKNARAVVVWPRRHGKDHTGINFMSTESQKRVGLYWIVYPFLNQGRRIAWQGIDERGLRFIDAFPKDLIQSSSNNDMRLTLKNGSVFQIMGADKPDTLVGSNPVGVIFSEWSLMDPQAWKLISPILAQNGGWAMFIYTPRGENHGWDLLQEAKEDPDWYWEHKTAKEMKWLNPDQLRRLKKDLKDDALFQQEAFCSFSTPIQGAYYASQMKYLAKEGRLSNEECIYQQTMPVHTAWDLGYDDATTVIFFHVIHGEPWIIDYHEESGEGLGHYVKMLQMKGYIYGKHYFPWDVKVHDLSTGKTRQQTLREMGMSNIVPVKKITVEDGIEAGRNLLMRCWLHPQNSKRLITALKSYTKKWDEQTQTFKKGPEHNWASHGADAFRTMAVGLNIKPKNRKQQTTMDCEYDVFA